MRFRKRLKPICLFYHCLFFIEGQPSSHAAAVVEEQMIQLSESGLMEAATEFHIGINGGEESVALASRLFPSRANITYHGLSIRSENPTIVLLEEWAKAHPNWLILYFHSKGATNDDAFRRRWRNGMMDDLVCNWRNCMVMLMDHDIVCSHWQWGAADGTQHVPSGNFLWLTSDFARTLPSIMLRERIKMSGLSALESRYEAEVKWGNGPRPKVFQFRHKRLEEAYDT